MLKENKKECRLMKFSDGMIYMALRNVIRFQLENIRLDYIKSDECYYINYNYWNVKILVESDEKIVVLVKGEMESWISFDIVFKEGWMNNMHSLKRSIEKYFVCPSKSVCYLRQEPKKFKKITSWSEIL